MATSSPRIFPDQRYACQSCGKGCKTPWKIKVEEARIERIQQSRGYRNVEREGYVPLPVTDGERQVGRRKNGACVFLRDSLCELHAELGFQAKPSVCQLFPFFYVNTPQGKFFSVSFSCPAVLESKGTPVKEHLPGVEETLKQSSTAFQRSMPADTTIPVTSDVNVTWGEYLGIERQLFDHLGAENPIKDLLLAAVALLDQCPVSEVIDLRKTIQNEGILQEALSLYAPITVHAIAQLENLDQDREGFRGLSLLGGGHGFRSTLLDAPLPNFEVHRPFDEACREALSRYFKNLLIGKQLIHGGTLVTRLLLLASAIGVHLYYLDFQRRLSGGEANTFDELLWSFDLIEVQMVTHSEKYVSLFSEFERSLSRSVRG